MALREPEGESKTGQKRVSNPPEGLPRILAHLVYDDVGAAVEWLTAAFGFRERSQYRHVDCGRITRTQMDVVDSVITLGEPSVHAGSPRQGVSSMLYVYVDDLDAVYRRAQPAGAKIVQPLEDRAWGDRSFQTTDPQGHQWAFARHVKDVEADEDHFVSAPRSS